MTERRAAKTWTSAIATTAAATAYAHAPTRRDPPSVATAQLGMSMTERRAAKTWTSARATTAAATAHANAPTRRDPPSVAIAQLGSSMTERRAAKSSANGLISPIIMRWSATATNAPRQGRRQISLTLMTSKARRRLAKKLVIAWLFVRRKDQEIFATLSGAWYMPRTRN